MIDGLYVPVGGVLYPVRWKIKIPCTLDVHLVFLSGIKVIALVAHGESECFGFLRVLYDEKKKAKYSQYVREFEKWKP